MTIGVGDFRSGPFVGDGVNLVFPFAFKCFSAAHLQVVHLSVTGVESIETIGFGVTLNPDQENNPGGVVTALVPPTVGENVTIVSLHPYTQQVVLPGGGNFSPLVISDALDTLTIEIKQLHERMNRTLQFPLSDNSPSGFLPPKLLRANTFAHWDANGNYEGAMILTPDTVLSPATVGAMLTAATVGVIIYPLLSAEGASVVNVQYEWGDLRRYGVVTGVDTTATLQAAINTGLDLIWPAGTYLANNLTQSANFQRWRATGDVVVKKNANGPILTAAGNYFEMNGIRFSGDAAVPIFTGHNVVLHGDHNRMINCASRWASGRAVLATGQHFQLYGTSDVYQTTDATANGYDIEVGLSGVATLYHDLRGIYTSQPTGGVKLIDVGSHNLQGGQFGKLYIASSNIGSPPAGVNGGTTSGCRILGNSNVELSSSSFANNTFGAITFTLVAGTSGHSVNDSNVWDNTAVVVDNSNNSVVVDLRRSVLQAYTPVWTCATTPPALGNGSLQGAYLRRGDECTAHILLTAGSTTTFGTGGFRFSLPFTPTSLIECVGAALILDAGTAFFAGVAKTNNALGVVVYANNQVAEITSVVPQTWAVGDTLHITVTFHID